MSNIQLKTVLFDVEDLLNTVNFYIVSFIVDGEPHQVFQEGKQDNVYNIKFNKMIPLKGIHEIKADGFDLVIDGRRYEAVDTDLNSFTDEYNGDIDKVSEQLVCLLADYINTTYIKRQSYAMV